jgi:hypothetical protein
VHDGSIQLDDAVLVGLATKADGGVVGVVLDDSDALDDAVGGVIALAGELHGAGDGAEAVEGGDGDRAAVAVAGVRAGAGGLFGGFVWAFGLGEGDAAEGSEGAGGEKGTAIEGFHGSGITPSCRAVECPKDFKYAESHAIGGEDGLELDDAAA